MEVRTSKRLLARESVERSIRQAIIAGSMQPGSLVKEQDLAEALGVSRVPIREALRTLEAEGLLAVHHGIGVRIAEIDMSAIREEFELRLILEPAAAAIACGNVTDETLDGLRATTERIRIFIDEGDFAKAARENGKFHKSVIELAGNGLLSHVTPGLWNALRLTLAFSQRYPEIAVLSRELEHQHSELIEALARRDAEGAYQAAAKHIRESYRYQGGLYRQFRDQVASLQQASDEGALDTPLRMPADFGRRASSLFRLANGEYE